jgi:DNA-binding response OmpR family regulator
MKTILLAEDDPQLVRMIRNVLEMESYTCLIASNGREAVEMARKYIPDLVISDIMMPDVNGYELKKELSMETTTALIPFIYLTSMSDREDIRKGMQLGADDYLFKPFRLEELLTSVEVQLKKREKLLNEYSKNEPVKNRQSPLSYNEYVIIKTKGSPRFIKINTISAVTADARYTWLITESGEKIITSKTMKQWEDTLPAANFIRIHRSYTVNISFIEKIEKWFNRSYKLKIKGTAEPMFISKRYYSKIKDHF